ncbi:hypothetical protein [Insolitispirillum peregrinum]|uniref:hypothetical protein n=1 Tax=Insolitispirillum peregrinum TaxID=80876 RepID=UPI00360FFB11
MTADKLLTTGQAAALIQPHLRGLDAFLWLTDTRRTIRHYDDPVRPPHPIRKPGGKKPYYRFPEVQRVIADLGGTAKPVSPAPITASTAADRPPVVLLGGGDRVQVVLDGRVLKLDPVAARRLAGDLTFAADRAEAAHAA